VTGDDLDVLRGVRPASEEVMDDARPDLVAISPGSNSVRLAPPSRTRTTRGQATRCRSEGLRDDAGLDAEYEALKLRLAQEHREDVAAYTPGKHAFVAPRAGNRRGSVGPPVSQRVALPPESDSYAFRASRLSCRLSRSAVSSRSTRVTFSSGWPDAGACDDDVGCLRR